ncbi:DUF3573 domain-containing protein [Francisella tularensis]|uniref:rhizoferrin import outer membrane protein FslE n=1 Tax=Francisella tularensis TaxID=263 RepID=UPI001324A9CE|nr:rhizoferrin import outer membrane protein FslE [Francisella tularensis]MWX71985.1 DUF3573 domain-containing protein [Francisella tularensis]
MLNKINIVFICFLVLSITPFMGFSNSFKNSNEQSQKSNSIDKQGITQLQSQIANIQAEINHLTQIKNSNNSAQFATYSSKVENIGLPNSLPDNNKLTLDIMTNIDSDSSIINLSDCSIGGIFDKDGGINVGGAPAITTQGEVTFLGAYSGNNTIPIGMISSNLFASTVIGLRNKFDSYSIFFGGKIEADAQLWFGSSTISNKATNLASNGQNISLTATNLYFLSNVGHYVTAEIEFNTTELNNFSLGNAFVIFGNLDTSPFFLTAGRNKLSVGAFGGGGPWTGGITKNFLSPGKVTNVSLNYKSDVWNANVAVFGSNDNQFNFSTGLFYAQKWTQDIAVGFNTGYVYNMAGAGNPSLSRFLQSQGHPTDTIGSFNVNTNITYTIAGGFLNLGAGWATTTNKKDFTGSSKDVLAGAWYAAANYSLVFRGRKTNFGISYGESYNSTNIPMTLTASPLNFGRSSSGIQKQIIVSAQRAYFDNNVLFGPEYSYQQLYNGKHMNTITIDMAVYL